jgi:ribonuclease P protein component
MLPKSRRLNLKKDFKWVVQGRKKETESFKLFFRPGNNLFPKIGVAISKGYFKKSHERVQAKRQSFSAVKSIYQFLPNNLNLVIMPKSAILKREQSSLIEELEYVQTDFNLSH